MDGSWLGNLQVVAAVMSLNMTDKRKKDFQEDVRSTKTRNEKCPAIKLKGNCSFGSGWWCALKVDGIMANGIK